MAKVTPVFHHDVVGHTFETNGVTFEVCAVDPYPESSIGASWKKGVMAAEEDTFVCAFFGKYLIPTIRVTGGVVQLKSVIIDGRTLTKSHAIATALGASKAFEVYPLKRIKA
jgi:hypothetical protein